MKQMKKLHVSKKKAIGLSMALFLVGLAIISYLGAWWPGIMLVIGVPLALREYLMGKIYDTAITLVIFLGVFVTVSFNISEKFLLPVLFMLGGIYIFFRDFIEDKTMSEADREEDLNEELEEDKDKKKR